MGAERHMKRRYVLLSGFGALFAVLGVRIALSQDESAIVKLIYKRLAYLRLDDDGVHRFARDLKIRNVVSSLRLHIIDAAGALYTNPALTAHNSLNDALHHDDDRVVAQYLISSDFFRNGADETRTVNYLGYCDPRVPCDNPFARTMLGPARSYSGVAV